MNEVVLSNCLSGPYLQHSHILTNTEEHLQSTRHQSQQQAGGADADVRPHSHSHPTPLPSSSTPTAARASTVFTCNDVGAVDVSRFDVPPPATTRPEKGLGYHLDLAGEGACAQPQPLAASNAENSCVAASPSSAVLCDAVPTAAAAQGGHGDGDDGTHVRQTPNVHEATNPCNPMTVSACNGSNNAFLAATGPSAVASLAHLPPSRGRVNSGDAADAFSRAPSHSVADVMCTAPPLRRRAAIAEQRACARQ